MKTGVATTLSIVGVLAAGGAAFALNSAVLTGSSSVPTAISPATTFAPSASPTSIAPGGQVTATGEQVAPQPTKVSDTVTTYRVAGAGSVIVDTASGMVSVTDIVPATGWTAEPARTETGGRVKVHFTDGTKRIEFTAQMVDGAVTVNAVTDLLPVAGTMPGQGTTSGSKPTVPQSLRGGDDDDGENHHDSGDHHEDEDDD